METFMVLVDQGHGQRWLLERKLTQYLVGKYDGNNAKRRSEQVGKVFDCDDFTYFDARESRSGKFVEQKAHLL
jgi:hypothetical protein